MVTRQHQQQARKESQSGKIRVSRYKARRQLTSSAAQVRTQGKAVSLKAAPEPAGRRCMGGEKR